MSTPAEKEPEEFVKLDAAIARVKSAADAIVPARRRWLDLSRQAQAPEAEAMEAEEAYHAARDQLLQAQAATDRMLDTLALSQLRG